MSRQHLISYVTTVQCLCLPSLRASSVGVWRSRCSHLAMASSRLRRLLVRLNLLPAKRKGRKKSKVDTFLDRGYNEKDIEKFMDLFGRRCISQDFISEMKEAFSLFDKVTNEKKLDRLKYHLLRTSFTRRHCASTCLRLDCLRALS